ncbi:MAG: sulfatase-like hydrolase/transferase [Sedimentisphaeraceae bacterium JB056]
MLESLRISRRDFMRRAVVAASAAGVGLSGLSCAGSQGFSADKRPNIIVIVPDDLGYHDLGCQGCEDIPTPHIDSIAANGVRFTDAYVTAPVCSPSRAGLVTGTYQQRFGYEYNIGEPGEGEDPDPTRGIPQNIKNIAEYLQPAGYNTAAIGKWHLGLTDEYLPNNRGFDEFFGFRGGCINYYEVDPPQSGDALAWYQDMYRNNKVIEEKEYLTDAFAREAEKFINKQNDEPFFMYLAFNAVHMPLQATQKYEARFEGKIDDSTRLTYAAMTSAMDDAVGRVLKALENKGITEDTLIFLVNDNGGPPDTGASNAPLRGWKSRLYEGGIRVPVLMQWKGKIPAGMVYSEPVISIDVVPTALAATDIEPGKNVEGVNLLPYLTGDKTDAPHDMLFWRYGNVWAVRKGKWKALGRESTGIIALYNLEEDIREKNVAEQYPDKVKELREEYLKWNSKNTEAAWPRPVNFPTVS